MGGGRLTVTCASYTCWLDPSFSPLPDSACNKYLYRPFLAFMDNTYSTMSSWIEPAHYDSHLNVPYPHPMDYPENSMRGADPPSMYTGYSYTPRPSPNSGRPPYNSGLYGPRPLPSHAPPVVEPIQGLPTSTMAQPEMADLEEEDDEYMDVEPVVDADGPLYQSEYYDEATQPQGKRRFVGGFIRHLRKIPKVVRRGFLSEKREVMTPPGLTYRQSSYRSPYMYDTHPEEPEEAPPYDAPSEPMDGDSRYTDTINMPSDIQSPAGPSRTLSQAIRAPRSESQLTYHSLTNPPARHVSQHGSLHQSQRSSPPRTVRNPDPPSPTDESGTAHPISPRPSQPPPELEPESASRTPHLSPLEPTRRPTVTVQSPNGSPVYFEPGRSEDYAGMDMDSPLEYTAEQSAPSSQFSRVARFFRDLNNLPWVAPNIAIDFDPTDAERGRNALTRGPGKSWYTGHLQDLDLLDGGGGGSSTRRLTAPSGHSFGRAPDSSATLAPQHGSGSASSSEGASTHHLPSAPAPHGYPYPVPTLALPTQPLFLYPYPALQPPPQQPQAQAQKSPQPSPAHAPDGTFAEQAQVSPQLSGSQSQSGVPGQPYYFMVAMSPPGGYMPGLVDPSRPPMQPAFGASFTSQV